MHNCEQILLLKYCNKCIRLGKTTYSGIFPNLIYRVHPKGLGKNHVGKKRCC